MSNPKYLNIPPKEHINFRIEKKLHSKLNNYANLKEINKSDAINEILKNFLNDRILTNTYLDNMTGLCFKIPLDLDIKKQCIKDKTILNSGNVNIGDNTALITINQIPNNLDVFTLSDDNTGGSYKANINGVLHHGIDFIFIPDVIKKPMNDKFDIDLFDALYLFYFEVKANNTVDVVLINPTDAINKISTANNNKWFDKVAGMVQILEDENKRSKYNYDATIKNEDEPITQSTIRNIIDTHFTILEMYFLNESTLNSIFKNENIILS